MAKYTIELRDIVSHENIFDFKYPFYDELKRHEFEEKFIKHFYFHEIGCETVDRFKHYLEDKMLTVFPYYNELFKSATIEYSILDNYKLTETYTRNVENSNKSSGISSTVGQLFGDTETETNQNKTVDMVGTLDNTSTDKEVETGKAITETSGSSDTTNNETVDGNTSKTNNETVNVTALKETEGSGSNETDSIKKFLDTPQGLTDLLDSNYLTNLTQDNANGTQSTESSENTTEEKTTTGTETGTNKQTTTGSTETETTGKTETDTTNDNTKTSTFEQDTTGKETTADNVTGNTRTEQKTTTDNNTRTYSDSEQVESYTLERKGNIGVDTDSDVIMKHNRLQKTLRSIERMFFEECEDLFMLVY